MAAAHIVYISVWRFLGATLLGVMRFIEWPTAARKSLHGWLGSDFDTPCSSGRLTLLPLLAALARTNCRTRGLAPRARIPALDSVQVALDTGFAPAISTSFQVLRVEPRLLYAR